MNIHVRVLVWTFFLNAYELMSSLLSSVVSVFLTLVFKWPACVPLRWHHFTFPPVVYNTSSFSTFSSTLGMVSPFNFSLSHRWEPVSHGSFNLHFLFIIVQRPHSCGCRESFYALIGRSVYLLLWYLLPISFWVVYLLLNGLQEFF